MSAALALREFEGVSVDVSDGQDPLFRADDIACMLGYKRLRDFTQLLKRTEKSGEFAAINCRHTVRRQSTGNGATREYEVQEYWLTRSQARIMCMKSEAPNSAEVRAHIDRICEAVCTGALVPAQSGLTLEKALELIDRQADRHMALMLAQTDKLIVPINHLQQQTTVLVGEVGELRVRMDTIDGEVKSLAARFPVIRKEPKPKDVARHLAAVKKYFNGMCPRCRVVCIVDEDGKRTAACNIDHFHSRDRATFREIWPICIQCNQDRERLAVRGADTLTFVEYLKWAEKDEIQLQLFGVAAPRLAG